LSAVASAVSKAKRELARRRKQLADATRPGAADLVVDSEWTWARTLLEARSRSLSRIPGVVGCGLATKKTGGVDTGRPCIAVLVRRKWNTGKRAGARIGTIPARLRSGKRSIPTDVVELREIDLDAVTPPGSSIGPAQPLRGTVGAYCRDPVTGAIGGLTAMHVTGRKEYPTGQNPPQVLLFTPSLADAGPHATLGALWQGSRSGIDAAKFLLVDPADATTEIPAIGRILGWRPTTFPGDVGAPVRLFGAVSGFQPGQIDTPAVYLPQYGLDSAILVRTFTQPGDSGCALVDSGNLVLGFLVGTAPSGLRVFCPVSLVLSRLGCDILT